MTPKQYRWKTAAVIRETADAVTIVFRAAAPFDYRPGQFINLSLDIEGVTVTRSYSLSSAPGSDELPAITVKRIPGGVMSSYIVRHAEEIRDWMVEGPYGNFCLPEGSGAGKGVVLIGGGSGITPLYSVLKYCLRHTAGRVHLVYGNRTPEDTLFRPALHYLQRAFAERLEISYFYSGKVKGGALPAGSYQAGRITRLALRKLLRKKEQQGESPLYFLCGPEGLIALAGETLRELQVDGERVLREYYLPPAAPPAEPVTGEVQEVLLHLPGQTNLLEVHPGKTILEAALEDHVPVPYSCRNGTCGKCAARLTSGRVQMRHNYALPEHLVQKGYVLLCQSHPMDNEVTVAFEG